MPDCNLHLMVSESMGDVDTTNSGVHAASRRDGGMERFILDTMPDYALWICEDGSLAYANASFCQAFGHDAGHIADLHVWELLVDWDPMQWQEVWTAITHQGNMRIERLARRMDGSTFPMEIHLRYVDHDGRTLVSGLARDISAWRTVAERLRRSEENFRVFFNTINDLIFVATVDGRIIFTNDAVQRKLGYSADQLQGMHVVDVHPQERREEAARVVEAMVRGETDVCPLPLVTSTGMLLPVETRVCMGQWNGVDCLFGVSRDLSAEQEAKLRFERLFRNNPALMALSEGIGKRFIDVNDTFLQVLGYTREEVIGRTSRELNLFPMHEMHQGAAGALERGGRITDVELQVRCRDGTLLDGLFSGELIESGGEQFHLTVMINITELKHAETKLWRSQQRLSDVIEGTNVGTWEWYADSGVLVVNERWAGITGHELMDLPPITIDVWRGMIHPEDRAEFVTRMEQVFARQREHYDVDCRVRHRSGAWMWVHIRGKVIAWGSDSRPQRMAGTVADITERKRAEEQLRENEARLTELNATKDKFFSIIAHDLRTPFSGILGFSDLLAMEIREKHFEKAEHYSGIINQSAMRAMNLLSNLLDWSRTQTGRMKMRPENLDLCRVIDEVMSLFHETARQKAIDLVVDIPERLDIVADREMIETVVRNLVSNAIKYSHDQGRVVIFADGTFTMVRLTVEDNGIGMDEATMSSLFRIEGSISRLGTSREKGSGLGLILCREFVEKHGGTIAAHSTHGQGSSFRVELPRRGTRPSP